MFRRLFGRGKDQAEPPHVEDKEAAIWEMIRHHWQGEQGHKAGAEPMDIAAFAPDPWPCNDDYEPNCALRLDSNFLSEDFCVLAGPHQTNYLIRAVMDFPIAGTDQFWAFGCWSTLSRENFDRYVEGFDIGEYQVSVPWFGWLCNVLKPVYIGPDPVGVAVCPQQERQRPKLYVRDDDHPLAIYQDEGLPPSVLLEILETYGLGPQRN